MQPPRLLLAEDDARLAALLRELLTEQEYEVTHVTDGQRALHLGLSRRFAVMVLDRGLPALDGVDVVRRLRAQGVTTPILVLSARGTPGDRVNGLDAGAEDYLGKPFDVEELLARLRALLRRSADLAESLAVPGHRLLPGELRAVGADGHDVLLSRTEADLLAALARRPRRVFSRAELLDRVFDHAATDGSVDTYVHYLRHKLGPAVVTTVRGAGYRLGDL